MSDRLSIITTKKGDAGSTELGDGSMVPKHHARIELLGTIDELNAWMGMLLAHMPGSMQADMGVGSILGSIQHELFNIGGEVSVPGYQVFDAQAIAFLENAHYILQKHLPPLKEFILPGGSVLGAHIHVARTVCRRAERTFWQLRAMPDDSGDDLQLNLGVYLNRLSDYLFTLARACHQTMHIADVLWKRSDD